MSGSSGSSSDQDSVEDRSLTYASGAPSDLANTNRQFYPQQSSTSTSRGLGLEGNTATSSYPATFNRHPSSIETASTGIERREISVNAFAQGPPSLAQQTDLPYRLAQAAQSAGQNLSVSSPDSKPLVTPPTAPNPSPPSPQGDTSHPGKISKKRGVPHVYHDFSSVPDALGYVRKKTGGVTQPFPEKLHELLTKETNVPDLVAWLPHGRAFIVRNPKLFTSQVMSKYFRQTKLTSFQRQLNLYGFRRITQGADAGAYYHELFLRGRPQLCMRMVRQKVKGTGHKQPADAQTEPNFYAMPPCDPETESPQQHSNNMDAYWGGIGQQHYAISASGTASATWPNSGQGASASSEETSITRTTAPASPGIQGLHGAANLLKGIAAGLPASSLSAPYLGMSAANAAASATAAASLAPAGIYAPAASSATAGTVTTGPAPMATTWYWPPNSSSTTNNAGDIGENNRDRVSLGGYNQQPITFLWSHPNNTLPSVGTTTQSVATRSVDDDRPAGGSDRDSQQQSFISTGAAAHTSSSPQEAN